MYAKCVYYSSHIRKRRACFVCTLCPYCDANDFTLVVNCGRSVVNPNNFSAYDMSGHTNSHLNLLVIALYKSTQRITT